MKNQHADTLMAMASFQRRLVGLASSLNGPRPEWEAERQAEIEALEAGAMALDAQHLPDVPALYDVAKRMCFKQGWPWTDPRTGITHQPPEKP